MSAAAQSPLAPRGDGFWRIVALSAGAHALLLAAALLVRPPPPIDLGQKPIAARLVRLGEKRPEHLLPRRDEGPAPAAQQPEARPAPPSPTPPAPKAMALPSPKARPAPPRAVPQGPARKAAPDAFASALSRVRRDKALEPLAGDPGGDPRGDAADGEAGDRYLALVQRALQDVYSVPPTISDRDRLHLKATLQVFIEQDGTIARWSFATRSGNASFDEALERAIHRARLPPPPQELRREVRSEGLRVNFSI